MTYGVINDWDGLVDSFDSYEEAEAAYEKEKQGRVCEGVEVEQSFVSLVELDEELEEIRTIKKVVAVEDVQLSKEIGSPKDNGYDWVGWAKWLDVTNNVKIRSGRKQHE
ncbi:hypothetical protein PQ478_09030 [Alkalihalophilus pseudofirmus]|uniref:hypothetical protein n=1 Tax=Alkalihalophilus pseudofirmus TaxID=79885 RepID=UPI00259B4D55|nr:hypothetical protein [Alkalihalophilus pseudofirmus]WEG18614.1 hypothetical protein PQ478_09030 [Alkalihalophilus pseudofirmus]